MIDPTTVAPSKASVEVLFLKLRSTYENNMYEIGEHDTISDTGYAMVAAGSWGIERVAVALSRGDVSDGTDSSSSSVMPTGTRELAKTMTASLGDRLVVPATKKASDSSNRRTSFEIILITDSAGATASEEGTTNL